MEPIQALNNAAYTNADRAKGYYFEQIEKGWAEKTPEPTATGSIVQAAAISSVAPITGAIFPVSIRCNHFYHTSPDAEEVMTAWALSPVEKASVIARFSLELWNLRQNLLDIEGTRATAEDASRIAEQMSPEQARERLADDVRSLKMQMLNKPTDRQTATTQTNALKRNLLRNGYSPRQVDDVVRDVDSWRKHAAHDHSRSTTELLEPSELPEPAGPPVGGAAPPDRFEMQRQYMDAKQPMASARQKIEARQQHSSKWFPESQSNGVKYGKHKH